MKARAFRVWVDAQHEGASNGKVKTSARRPGRAWALAVAADAGFRDIGRTAVAARPAADRPASPASLPVVSADGARGTGPRRR